MRGLISVFTRLSGAIIRAFMVVILVVMPALLLPRDAQDNLQIVVLFAIFAAIFTIAEYSSASPSIIEFREAPPFNRVRFTTLFATVLCLSMVFRGYVSPSGITELFQQAGAGIGAAADFPYSPVRLMVLMLPQDTSAQMVARVRDGAGLSYMISAFAIIWFVIVLRLQQWPRREGPFNVWVNLPTFNSAGGDVVERLERDGRINVILGFLLPFLVPAVLKLFASFGTPVRLDDMHTLLWMVAAWAFLPASILMRGVALSRVAQMIRMQRNAASQRTASSGHYMG
ncbi:MULTISPECIES: hypothetical protein [Rhodobacterales]|uniref:hypothetical protein n=1 Tax=Rhodobacterales TaxID=204455 RepID=UPI00215D7931|nr:MULTISPECIES: hypothetical protein [Rhodobacterales]MDO6588767.1 hypothetical protein [Yoonia sp. 1_MG-2023]